LEYRQDAPDAYLTLLRSLTALDFGHSVGRVEHLKPLDLVTGRSCEEGRSHSALRERPPSGGFEMDHV
jgi:hypothetical protein